MRIETYEFTEFSLVLTFVNHAIKVSDTDLLTK